MDSNAKVVLEWVGKGEPTTRLGGWVVGRLGVTLSFVDLNGDRAHHVVVSSGLITSRSEFLFIVG